MPKRRSSKTALPRRHQLARACAMQVAAREEVEFNVRKVICDTTPVEMASFEELDSMVKLASFVFCLEGRESVAVGMKRFSSRSKSSPNGWFVEYCFYQDWRGNCRIYQYADASEQKKSWNPKSSLLLHTHSTTW